ncbi:hypothetical protein [Acidithiobacillus acidisediminis]|jgi:hypothetical protein|uniref:hypothetical protein n=1 Tax=Acidithiobacillus TaxID=119977 RepID=UPI00200F5BD8|nr:hypothetical protein [Acidithiobacillus sp. S30A2]
MTLNVEHLLRTADTLEQALLAYRANRNSTAHDYGEGFANETLKLLPQYLQDVRQLAPAIQAVFDAAS